MGADGSGYYNNKNIIMGPVLKLHPSPVIDYKLHDNLVNLMNSWYIEGQTASRRRKKVLWAKADELYDILYPENKDNQ